jgi:hypothetical protein
MLLAPSWVFYAAVGLAAGWLTRLTLCRFLALRHRWLTLAGWFGGAFLVLLAFAISIPSLMKSRDAGRAASRQVSYSADVRYGPDAHVWRIRDEIAVSQHPGQRDWELERIYEQVSSGELEPEAIDAYLQQQEDGTWLEETLAPFGWTRTSEPDSQPTFRRERCIDATCTWYALQTANQIPVLSAATELPPHFYLKPYGELRFYGPRNSIGATRPSASQREFDGRERAETRVVPFEFPLLPEQDAKRFVQVELLHPAFRNPLIAAFRRLTSVSAINWFLVAVFGVFQDRLRTRVGSPIVNWLGRRLRIGWLDDTPAAEPPPEGGRVIPRRRSSAAAGGSKPLPGILAALSDEPDEPARRSA